MPFPARAGSAVSMLSDVLTVTLGGGMVKAIGLVKVVLAARIFGTSDAQDAFVIAFLAPSLLGESLSAAASPALIPALMRLPDKASRTELYQQSLGALAASMITLTLVLALAMPFVLAILAHGFTQDKMGLARGLFLCLLPILPLRSFAITWRTLLHTHQKFVLVAVAPAITPVISIVILLAVSAEWGIFALAAGEVAGCLLESLILGAGVWRLGYPLLPAWRGFDARLRELCHQFGMTLSAFLLLGCSPLIDNAMASALGPGSVSTLSFGTRLVMVIQSIGPAAVGTATLPHLARMIAKGDRPAMRRTLWEFLRVLLLLAIPLTALAIYASEPLVRLALQRGAFNEAATRAVAQVQRFSLVQVPFALTAALGLRLASALGANRLLLPAALAAVAVTFVADLILRQFMGVAGIALAGTLSQLAFIATLGIPLIPWFRKRIRMV